MSRFSKSSRSCAGGVPIGLPACPKDSKDEDGLMAIEAEITAGFSRKHDLEVLSGRYCPVEPEALRIVGSSESAISLVLSGPDP